MIPKQGRAHLCKECGKTHAPRCDKCGSTRDLRSYHGPCGTCAFGKTKMSFLLPAFLDEMEKISVSVQDIKPDPIKTQGAWNFAKSVPQRMGRGLQGAASNLGQAAGAFATPGRSLREGWKATWSPGGKPLHPGFKAMMALGAYNDVKNVAHSVDPAGLGRSRLHRAATAVGGQLGGIIGAPYGLTGGIGASVIGSGIGSMAGRAVDRVRGYKRPVNTGPRRLLPNSQPLGQSPHLPPQPVGQR